MQDTKIQITSETSNALNASEASETSKTSEAWIIAANNKTSMYTPEMKEVSIVDIYLTEFAVIAGHIVFAKDAKIIDKIFPHVIVFHDWIAHFVKEAKEGFLYRIIFED